MKKMLFVSLLVVCVAALGMGTLVQAQTEVNLSIWTHDQLYIDYFTTRLPEWEALNPDITFTYDFQVISNAPDAYLQALAAGETVPDLLGIEQGGFPNFMKNGVIASQFVDLTDVIGDRRADYAEGRFSIYTYEGRIYAIESSLTGSVYYYQPAVYEAAGVEVPTTWEEVLVAGEQLAANGSAFGFATNSADWFQMMFNQRGGEVFNAAGEFVFNDEVNRPIAIEVSDFIQRGVANGTFFVVLGGDLWSGATVPTAYREGQLAGVVMPDWWSTCCLKPSVEDMAGQWAVAKPPVWEAGGYDTLVWGGTGFAVTKNEDAEIATQFIDFMYLGLDSQVMRFQAINMFPTMLEAANDPRITELEDPFYNNQKIGAVLAELAPEVPVWYQSPFRAAWATAVGDNLPLLFDSSMTAEEFVDQVTLLTQDAIDFGF